MRVKPYKGKDKFIFFSYSHKDIKEVLEIIGRLQSNGYRVWFDEGIDPGTEWDDNIALQIELCSYYIAYVTTNFVDSQNCRDELNYARDLDKDRLMVYGEDVELPRGMKMRMNRLQAIFKNRYSDPEDFYEKLNNAAGIQTCRREIAEAHAGKPAGREKTVTAESFKVGSSVYFGSYKQNSGTSNGEDDIEWLVLAKEGNRILVISKYALACQPYNTTFAAVTWETCTLRKWLNFAFYNIAFTNEEKKMILSVVVSADRNPEYNTAPGKNTTDKVFLLSITEADKYFNSGAARQCKGTAYCFERGAYKAGNGNCWWWLRSPGSISCFAAYVNFDGSVYDYGNYIYYSSIAVRPAMWIDFGS
ncbi:MAG: toll/interleukin-1 receptor domain-containing protein [Clostridiales bacterium]|nr:toll/interleukin-1 receptor domain-containing protein [Clostridiales bacterium]MBR0468655.1 toll/interleukin-1 receptor domain-containing protein [Mogibacterium sp.]